MPRARASRLLLGRLDGAGRLRYAGRSTTIPVRMSRDVGEQLTPTVSPHPWWGWSFSAGRGTRDKLHVTRVQPELAADTCGDTSMDSVRHAARVLRQRADMAHGDVPPFGAGNEAAGGQGIPHGHAADTAAAMGSRKRRRPRRRPGPPRRAGARAPVDLQSFEASRSVSAATSAALLCAPPDADLLVRAGSRSARRPSAGGPTRSGLAYGTSRKKGL